MAIRRHGETIKAFHSSERIEEGQRAYEIAKLMSRNDMFLKGMIPVEELDDEELRYGIARDYNGSLFLPANKTQILPDNLAQAVQQEHAKRMNERMRRLSDDALDTMAEVMYDKTAEPGDRLTASKYLFERVNGKTPDRVAITVQRQPWEEVFVGIAQTTRDQSRVLRAASGPGIIEGELQADLQAPEVRPYGYIQAPTAGDQNLGDANDDGGGKYGEAPTPNPTGDWVEDQVADRIADPEVHGIPDLLEERPTVPKEHIEPPHQAQPNLRVPDHFGPVNTMATAPSGRYRPPQAQQQYAEPSQPMSQRLQDRATAASELAEQRKANKEMREGAKCVRADSEEGKARGKAKVHRIIQRTLGLDASTPIDIAAEVQPVADGEEVVKFRIQ